MSTRSEFIRERIRAHAGGGGAVNPFDVVGDRLVEILRLFPGVGGAVTESNIVRWDRNNPDAGKDQVQDADSPMIEVAPAGFVYEPVMSSSSARLMIRHGLMLGTTDKRVGLWYNDLKWAAICAIEAANLDPTRGGLDSINWITNWRLQDGVDSETEFGERYGTEGWAAMLVVDTDCVFTREGLARGVW